MRAPINLIKGDEIGVETDYRDNLPVNMYAVEKQVLGAAGYMLCYPGLELFATGAGVDRGANYNERFEQHYRVSGTSLIRVNNDGSKDVLGSVPGASQVRMKDFYSFNTQGIIADGAMFLYDPVGGFAEVTDADLGSPIDGVWVDGYYFLTDGEYIYHTDIADETAIDPLKFATAEFMPDPTLGVSKTQDNKVVVWGRYSVEYFINDASIDFAFTRVSTRAQKIGIVATHAKTEGADGFYITGGRKQESLGIHFVSIGSSVKVSTREVDKILEDYTESDLADMRMETRVEKDVTFILIHLPSDTLCFNETIAKSLGKKYAWSLLNSGVEGEHLEQPWTWTFPPTEFEANIDGDSIVGTLSGTGTGIYPETAPWVIEFSSGSLEFLYDIEGDTYRVAVSGTDVTVLFDNIGLPEEWDFTSTILSAMAILPGGLPGGSPSISLLIEADGDVFGGVASSDLFNGTPPYSLTIDYGGAEIEFSVDIDTDPGTFTITFSTFTEFTIVGTGGTIIDRDTYRAINGVFDAELGEWVYGDKTNTNIGKLDTTVFSQYDEIQDFELYTPFLKLENYSVDKIEIETIPVVSVADGGIIKMSLTTDGVNYGTEDELAAPIAGSTQRYIRRRIGRINDWVGFKFSSSTKTRMAFALMDLTYS